MSEKNKIIVALGSDHGAYALKMCIFDHLVENGFTVIDCGTDNTASCDYPIYAKLVAERVLSEKANFGILCCGTGIGVSIAANRIPGIRAALCSDLTSAELTRQHNDANILCLGGRMLQKGFALSILDKFLATEFSNDARHINRIKMLEQMT